MQFPNPMLGSAVWFAFDKATTEGKITIVVLCFVSLVSWSVILTKSRQLWRARRMTAKFFEAYRATRDPLDLFRRSESFDGAPANEVYQIGAEELAYHLKENPVRTDGRIVAAQNAPGSPDKEAKPSKSAGVRISRGSFETVRVALERAVGTESLRLEKGMIVLSTAVAGGPFIGLLGTVWGVMETFSGVARANTASLTAMAPGVAGALVATVTGLLVAIPAMFAYNFMVTSIRAFTQELDNFAAEFSTSIEHQYVDNRSMADELADALVKARETQKGFESTLPL